jgi:tetratricopeptide (TPR) repeat protein
VIAIAENISPVLASIELLPLFFTICAFMFTINIYLRFALIALTLIAGVVLTMLFGFWYALPFYLIGLTLLISYIFLGTVQSAALLMQKMDFEGADRRLNLTLKPDWLYSANRSYYYMIKGGLAMQMKKYPEAEVMLEKAQKAGLPGDNEKAMVFLQQANLAVIKNNYTGAQSLMRQAKQLKVTEAQIKEQIAEFDKALKSQGAMKTMQQRNRGAVMQPGGKRRRPKAR